MTRASRYRRWIVRQLLPGLALLAAVGAAPFVAHAQETICARVKIEIQQELTLERQAFDATMKINNTTDSGVIENVSVVLKVTDELGAPVPITDNPNDTSGAFFVRLSTKDGISDVDGTGSVAPATTATIDWLLIPAPGSAGSTPLGKKYLVGATLRYRFAGADQVLDVDPDVITVKPLPLLTLDYFLPHDVFADDPLTPEIEPVEPFTLGVRVKNTGMATAKSLKIDSAQPKIVENNQGLLINFKLTGSFVDDAPVQNSLLIDFGDIAAATSKTGRWSMETTLAGTFVDFGAKFTHSDELGGSLTSIMQATTAHSLIHDVRVDLPGRDEIRDFLARDGDVVRVYESHGLDTLVTDRSAVAQLTAVASVGDTASYRLTMPPTAGFVYVKLPDPFNGTKALGQIVRSDAKAMLADNVWLSKTRNETTKQWEYWVSFFDVNTTGTYDTEFRAPAPADAPPVIQFIPDRVTSEGAQVSFLVEASSPNGRQVQLSAAPLPAGARFTQPADLQIAGLARGVFDWTPPVGSAGTYLIVYSANDGLFTTTRSASITVEVAPPPGPGTPMIVSPVAGASVATLRPTLKVQTATVPRDPTTQVQLEVYGDEAMTQLVASALVDKALDGPTAWDLPVDLRDNTRYWWRARAFDGTIFSLWVNASFFVNLFNDAPDSFNLTSPAPGAEVASAQPLLAWTNSVDKDGDAITYSVVVYSDAALTTVVASAADLPPGENGTTSWMVAVPLVNHATYYWNVTAKDALGAMTATAVRPFVVNTSNAAPTAPVILSPAVGGESPLPDTALTIQNSSDADGDPISYVFEIDTVNTFDSSDKRASGPVAQGSGATTSWVATGLIENKRYWWRVKAQDGRAESAWVVGNFLENAANDAPPAPTLRNPGGDAWSATQQPVLEVNPVVDPEGQAVRYEFEVYTDAALTNRVVDGLSPTTSFMVPTPLADKTTHYWRARALDASDAASAWSDALVLYISTGPYQPPTIQLTAPSTPVAPDTVTTPSGTRRQVTIRWTGTDVNIEPTIALFYDTIGSGFAGTLIVDALRQGAGTSSGSYVWDVTALPPGAYHVYGVISDAKSSVPAYAAGAVVIPSPVQTGSVVVTAGALLMTTEDGGTATFSVRLGSKPAADVTVPVSSSDPHEGLTTPPSLVFTPLNWATNQTVTVTGQNDCIVDGLKTYRVLTGKAVAADPNYIGLSGAPVNLMNLDSGDTTGSTNNPNIRICGLSIVSERKISVINWEYVLRAELSNTGANVPGVTAKLTTVPAGFTIVENSLAFGAVNMGDTAKTTDTVTVRSLFQVPPILFSTGTGFRWTVTVP